MQIGSTTQNITDQKILNQQMVDNQLRTAGVFNTNVIDAFLSVNRSKFVPSNLQALAFSDATILLESGIFLLSPLVLGKILQSFPDVSGKTILIYGASTGYSAALFSKMQAEIVAVQTHHEIASFSKLALKNFKNIVLVEDETVLDDHNLQFDFILIEGSVEIIPQKIFNMLKDNGTLTTIMAGKSIGQVTRFVKNSSNISQTTLFEANAPLLAGFEAKNEFIF